MKKLLIACCALSLLAAVSGCSSMSPGGDPTLAHAPMGPGPLPDAPTF